MAKKKKQTFIPKNITKKHVQAITITILILISMFFAIYFRSYPASLPMTEEWAEQTLENNLKNQLLQGINQQYPNLPADQKQALLEEQLQDIVAQQQQEYDQQIQTQASLIKQELQDDNNQTYLLAIDPYYYLRNVENVLDHGYGADKIVNGTYVDDHMLAPIGQERKGTDFHTRFSAIIYKIVNFFKQDAKPLNVFFWIPVIISALAVIPAFFITRKRAGMLGGFIASMLVAVHSTFLGRTAAGFSDTDGYNVLFPLLIFWAFIEAFEAKTLKNKAIYSGITGLLLGLYARFWTGWWYIFDFILAAMIIYLGYSVVKTWLKEKDLMKGLRAEETKQTGITIGSLLVSSGIFVSLFLSFNNFITAPIKALGFTSIQNAAKIDLWPNVYTTVAELNRASLSSIVNQIGGSTYFYLACLGLIVTLVSIKELRGKDWALLGGSAFMYLLLITKPFLTGNPYVYLTLLLLPVIAGLIMLLKDDRNIDVQYAIVLVVWFIGTIYASTQGVRFILLLVPAYSIAFGVLIGQAYRLVTNWTAKQWDVEQLWIKTGVIVVAVLLLLTPVKAAHQTALHEIPSMNDTWWDTLTQIKEESAPDAIINSWWDFGHWFKAVGDRAVTFDGTSQNTPMAHWIGKALATSNEAEAIGILRMLDCGSRKGFDELAMSLQGIDDLKDLEPEASLQARKTMSDIILVEKEEARQILKEEGIENADEILALTHCQPPENYFITSGDMVGKASVWGHFGNWDFNKAYIYNVLTEELPETATSKIQDLYDIEKKEASQLYYEAIALPNEQQANAWISPWPQYLTKRAASCVQENNTVTCNVNANLGNQQGQRIIAEQAVVNLTQPGQAIITIGAYDPATGARLGGNSITPRAVSIGQNNTITRTVIDEPQFDFELFVADVNGQYKAVIGSSELVTSMFTRLFFLEGAYTEQFDKFSDMTSSITGDRIIVWKVDWN